MALGREVTLLALSAAVATGVHLSILDWRFIVLDSTDMGGTGRVLGDAVLYLPASASIGSELWSGSVSSQWIAVDRLEMGGMWAFTLGVGLPCLLVSMAPLRIGLSLSVVGLCGMAVVVAAGLIPAGVVVGVCIGALAVRRCVAASQGGDAEERRPRRQ